MTRTVAIVLYPGFVALDAVGPHDVFALAARWTAERTGVPAYQLIRAAAEAGPVPSASGLSVVAEHGWVDLAPVHTLLVPGGWMSDGVPRPEQPALVRGVAQVAATAERVAAVCTGAFTLAQAGLLDGRRATTHWGAAAQLAAAYPDVDVDLDALFVEDGPVWTSAGVTAGIDLALALVERDCGIGLARDIACELVMFLRRPGGQSQFSSYLRAPVDDDGRIASLQQWIADHLHEDLRVERLAQRVSMSPRHFARVFRQRMGLTPARFVRRCRVEAVRNALQGADTPLAQLADRFGFGTTEQLRRAFQRAYGVPPAHYRQRFGGYRDPSVALAAP